MVARREEEGRNGVDAPERKIKRPSIADAQDADENAKAKWMEDYPKETLEQNTVVQCVRIGISWSHVFVVVLVGQTVWWLGIGLLRVLSLALLDWPLHINGRRGGFHLVCRAAE